MKIRALTSVHDIVDTLGGTTQFARRYGYTKQQINYYRVMGRLPAKIFLTCTDDLRTLGCRASSTPITTIIRAR